MINTFKRSTTNNEIRAIIKVFQQKKVQALMGLTYKSLQRHLVLLKLFDTVAEEGPLPSSFHHT